MDPAATLPPHDASECNQGLVDVPPLLVAISALPLLGVSVISWLLDLQLVSDIWIATIRTYVQLAVLGYILKPIFEEGNAHWWVVLLYVLLMMFLAARECSSRPKYSFRGQFWIIFAAIFVNVTLVSAFAFGVVIQPKNLLDPQYVIPICGMLFGNIITGISLSLNALMTSMVEQSSEIELFLSFGATRYEASRRLLQDSIRTGTMPTLNSMAVIGLVSIPGMMTGQVLGGSPPDVAARYQMLIMYLIAVCGFGSILTVSFVVMRVSFSKEHQLLPENFTKQVKKTQSYKSWIRSIIANSCCILCNIWCSVKEGYRILESPASAKPEDLSFAAALDGLATPQVNSIKINKLNRAISEEDMYLEVDEVSRTVPVDSTGLKRRTLFQNFSFNLGKGEIAVVTGPSGSGKSQFLRLVAGLVPLEAGHISLNGKPRSRYESMCLWRQKVRYVTQYKIDSPGTPRMYLRQISELAVNRTSLDAPSYQEMLDVTTALLHEWGVGQGYIDKEWKSLSGGEAQRVIVALAIASRPKVLLLDESTSALDSKTKLRVEKSIERVVQAHAIAVLWITHDDEQVARMEYDLSPRKF